MQHAFGGDEADVVDGFAGAGEEVEVAGAGFVDGDRGEGVCLVVGVARDALAEDAADRVHQA